jgi:hypothetical protein
VVSSKRSQPQQGRDRLLELNSFRPAAAAELVKEIHRQDADHAGRLRLLLHSYRRDRNLSFQLSTAFAMLLVVQSNHRRYFHGTARRNKDRCQGDDHQDQGGTYKCGWVCWRDSMQ